MFLYKGQTFLLVRDLNLCPVELVNVIGSKLWWNVTDIESWDFKIQKILPKLFLSSFWALTFHTFSLEAMTYRNFLKFGQKHFKFIKSHTSFIRFQLLLFTVMVKQTEIKQNRINLHAFWRVKWIQFLISCFEEVDNYWKSQFVWWMQQGS